MEKIKYFEAFCYYIIKHKFNWNFNFSLINNEKNYLPRLKLMLLLFLACQAYSLEDEKIYNIFDNFKSFYLAPIEFDVFNSIKNNELTYFSIFNNHTEIKNDNFKDIEEKYLKIGKKMFDSLFNKNSKLFEDDYLSIDILETVKKYSSWRLSVNYQKENISKELLLLDREDQFYY